MPLPFPHGTASGQIANGSFFDNGDTPGSVGGRFVGFGEYGTSAIGNRAAWALSCNIDYLYRSHSSPKAKPAIAKFTSSGVAQFVIPDTVFCGDDTPPLPLPEAMLLLFAVLDNQYYTLKDGSGNDVRVSNVTLSGDMYGHGFVVSPTVTFCTVNPSTGAVVEDPYTIPNDVVVQVAYGSQSSLEDLPIGALLRFGVLGLRSGAAGSGGASQSPDDYVFAKEDFGIYAPATYLPGATIGTWLQVVGDTDGYMFKDVDVVFDRSTILEITTPPIPGSIELKGPPLYLAPTASLLKFSVGFALYSLSNACGGETYTVIAGFNPDTIATDTGAYFFIDEHSHMYAVWKDDTGDDSALIPITIQPQVWYDCTISFNATSVDFIVNGVIVYTTDFTAASKALLISVPLRITNTYGNAKYMWADYAEIHTEGHQSRALT